MPHAARPGLPAAAGEGRLVFLDVLRVLIISMVIIHHAAQAYGPTGGFWPVEDAATSEWFRPFYTVNAAVGLGMLFLIAGYFTPASYERKGPRRFLRERWTRIGIPLVVFVVFVNIPLAYLASGRPEPWTFIKGLYGDAWQGAYFHLWFLGHLLIYTAVYALWAGRRRSRAAAGRAAGRGETGTLLPPPGHAALLGFATVLILVTWIIRWWFPVDSWLPLFFVVPAEPANFAQYVSLFALGILAYRNHWFTRIPRAVGLLWLAVGFLATVAIFSLQAFNLWFTLTATGGFGWPSLVRVSLETLVCIGLSVGLIVLFREVWHRGSRLLAAMATASYAAYILHVYIVVGLQVAVLQYPWPAGVKFLAVAVAGVALSFGIGHFSRTVPGLGLVLGTRRERPPAAGGTSAPHPA